MVIGIVIGAILGISIGIILPKIKTLIKPSKKVELSDEQIEREKRIKKSFNELMEYDYSTALGGGISE